MEHPIETFVLSFDESALGQYRGVQPVPYPGIFLDPQLPLTPGEFDARFGARQRFSYGQRGGYRAVQPQLQTYHYLIRFLDANGNEVTSLVQKNLTGQALVGFPLYAPETMLPGALKGRLNQIVSTLAPTAKEFQNVAYVCAFAYNSMGGHVDSSCAPGYPAQLQFPFTYP